ncbi:MAG TPA: type II toxin-antitoxin system VapB family antitoxin [Xanthomonadales bacterium]|jgi:Arc/MetJ family transcription regulator|nr:type II toxin-antitoxin system VapB family antitoxin [Xanthomonadales bacterium]
MQTRTNIVLDDQLVESAMKKAGVRTKREAVEAALRAFVQEADYASLLALRGSGGVAEGYDPKAYAAAKNVDQ